MFDVHIIYNTTTVLMSVHIHDDLKLGCDDFICTIVYSLMS